MPAMAAELDSLKSWEKMVAKIHFPERALLAAGFFGGPVVITSLTPFRNAMSLCSQDQTASLRQLYDKALGRRAQGTARLRIAYTGALTAAPAACPQWCILGPAFHLFNSATWTPVALLATAVLETLITYGSQSRNAQMAYNAQIALAPTHRPGPGSGVALFSPVRAWGPGAELMVLRNACSMSGIRAFSPPLQVFLTPVLPSGPREMVSDLSASMLVCLASTPLNSMYTYTVTAPLTWSMPMRSRFAHLAGFLRSQYIAKNRRGFSPLAARDLAVRCVYTSCVFSMFSFIERLSKTFWPSLEKVVGLS